MGQLTEDPCPGVGLLLENRPGALPLGPPDLRVEDAQGGAWVFWRRGKKVEGWCCHLFPTSDACPHTGAHAA